MIQNHNFLNGDINCSTKFHDLLHKCHNKVIHNFLNKMKGGGEENFSKKFFEKKIIFEI
jgi:hypothetical protein